jgi:hypothetical protein
LTVIDPAESAVNASAIDELVTANRQSNETMLALVEHVRKETVARDRKIDVLEQNNKQTRLLLYLVSGAVVMLLLLASFNAIGITAARQNVEQSAAIAKNVDQTNATLLDCLNSRGACGQANAASQKGILDSVKQYNLVGFYCIRVNPATADPKGEAFLKCMQRLYPGGPVLERR